MTFRRIAGGLLLVLLLACSIPWPGCASTRMGTDFNSDNVSRLKVGETTEDEVIQLIGVPGHRTRSADGTVTLTYMYSPGRVVHPFTVFDFNRAQKVGAGMKTLTVILDGNGKVKDFTESSSQ